MMQVDPKRRVSAKEALESEWINTPDDDLRRCSLEQSLREIISFHARRKLKGAIGAVMVAAGARFWDISTAAIWRDEMFDSDKAVDGDCKKAEIQLTSGTGGDDLSPYTNKPPTFESLYKLEKKIEEGKHESYWEGKYLESDNSYTIKVVNRKDLSHADEGAVLNEVAVLKSLRHKHIVNLLDFFEEPGNFYLVLHRCSGGDVLDRVASLNQYSEKDARELSRGLLSAVEFMHNRGIAHRNLKVRTHGRFCFFYSLLQGTQSIILLGTLATKSFT
jgi:serine/threonine protein kinase